MTAPKAPESLTPIWETRLPFEMERGDGALIAKAMRAYRPETSEEEGIVTFFIEQFEKLDKPAIDEPSVPAYWTWNGTRYYNDHPEADDKRT